MNNYSYIQHTGIKGMKWGQRRYQNPDGTLTAAGKIRYGRRETRAMNRLDQKRAKASYRSEPYLMKDMRLKRKRTNAELKRTDDNAERINKKLAKLDSKIAKNQTRISKLTNSAAEYEAQINAKIKDLTGKGIKVHTSPTWRTVDMTIIPGPYGWMVNYQNRGGTAYKINKREIKRSANG